MSDQKNSTQISNSKGETNIRPTPIGGNFASFEEKEPELGAILENCASAFGEIKFNPVFSTLFEAGKWIALGTREAVTGVLKEVAVSQKPQQLPKPEAQEKKMKESLIYRQSIETFKREEARIPQQEHNEMVKMALRMDVNVENLADKIQAPHLKKEELLKTYYIARGASVVSAEKKATKQAKKQQNMVETSKQGNSNKMRLDAQEGNSMVANQISSAG